MIIKNIYKKIEINPFFYVIAFLAFITGNFKNFCLFMSILIVHECGHILSGIYFKWVIEKITLYPFGALTIFKDHLNKPIKEEFWIVIMGPIFQCLFYQLLSSCSLPHLKNFHYGLLLFNLLPIVPLDGSKLVLLFYQRFFSYFSSHYFIFILSIGSIFILLPFVIKTLISLLLVITLIPKIISFFSERYSLFSKFLLERVLYSFNFPRRKIIDGNQLKKMKRDTKHLFLINNSYVTEQRLLQKMFDFKRDKW